MSYQALIADSELATRQSIRFYLEQAAGFQVAAEASTGPEALTALLHHRPDVVFVNLHLPRLDGFSVLREIWPYFQPQVVFLSASDQPMLLALEESGVPYLPKPFTELQFHQTLCHVKTNLAQPQSQETIDMLMRLLVSEEPPTKPTYLKRMLVKDNHKLFFIKAEDILYFDADGNYITLHTLKRNYTLYESLTQLEQRLDPADFTRINRSYIVNLNYVEELECYFNGEYLVKLTGGHTLKWTRFYRDNVKTFLAKNR
ncbi:LytR/AlgR family response regulator transcription factor [Hymenobacter crusticola]|uniref:DNA-binding response regulator n=1 Tax=Hymenobacter crusticola TaxID=1770526 RepID=A0A243WHJ3_9BACT|nr:LytTR family DNA-binding domain-containing protein [Hymenobacter crusticola]OUJ74695.1 hypothetical protein BXP70_07990 [Hymenobacter crusticola]